jgi:DNA-binding response OmpR family regulator
MRILVVDDDNVYRGYVKKALNQAGYVGDEASTAKEAVGMASERVYDLFLLDVRLGTLEDGNWIVRTLRTCGHAAGIFMVSGQGAEEDKIESIDGGADDYIVKPFRIGELLARIRAWQRRFQMFLSSEVHTTMLTIGDLSLNLLRHHAICREKTIPLSASEFKLLQCMMTHPGRVLSQSVIAQHIWNDEFDRTSNAVEVAINRLRKKLGDTNATMIKTVHGAGYVIEDT